MRANGESNFSYLLFLFLFAIVSLTATERFQVPVRCVSETPVPFPLPRIPVIRFFTLNHPLQRYALKSLAAALEYVLANEYVKKYISYALYVFMALFLLGIQFLSFRYKMHSSLFFEREREKERELTKQATRNFRLCKLYSVFSFQFLGRVDRAFEVFVADGAYGCTKIGIKIAELEPFETFHIFHCFSKIERNKTVRG